jgi:hypothetical protein
VLSACKRAGSALYLNEPVHLLALDGVYRNEGWSRPIRFNALQSPGNVDVDRVVRGIQKGAIELSAGQGDGNDHLSERTLLENSIRSVVGGEVDGDFSGPSGCCSGGRRPND